MGLEDVLAQCVASPDDDTPRLVWADLVGGERGELVVIQCDLARGGLSPAEAGVRRARERELLAAHGIAWAGETARRAKRWSFHRGFIEAALVEARFTPLDEPLLRSLTVEVPEEPYEIMRLADRLAALPKLTGLMLLDGTVVDGGDDRFAELRPLLPALDHLRSFGCSNLGRIDFVSDLLERVPVEQLVLRVPLVEQPELAELLSRASSVTALDLTTFELPPAVFELPLRALQAGWMPAFQLPDLARLAGTLELLGCAVSHDAAELWRALAALAKVRTLELAGDHETVLRALLDDRVTLPSLQTLVLRLDAPDDLASRLAAKLAHVDIQRRGLDDDDELLHRASSILTGVACVQLSQPAILVDLLAGRVHDVAARPIDKAFVIGRGNADLDAEGAGSLLWRAGHHELHTFGYQQRIVNDEIVEVAALRDGDRIVLGGTWLAYYCGPGADERARAAAIDGWLQPHRPGEHQLRVVGWRRIVERIGEAIATQLFRELARQVARHLEGGEWISLVAIGVLGVEPESAAIRLAADPWTIVIGDETFELELAAYLGNA